MDNPYALKGVNTLMQILLIIGFYSKDFTNYLNIEINLHLINGRAKSPCGPP